VAITSNGESYGASRSPAGDILVQTRLGDGRLVIVKYGRDGSVVQMTDGPSDTGASYAKSGSTWLYSDYQTKAIRSCTETGCRDLRHEPLLPAWPVMSPDERRVAYLTVIGSPRLHVIDASGAGERDLGPTAIECPAVWTGPSTLWRFSGSGYEREWIEIDVGTGHKTGRSKSAPTFDPDKFACGWESEPAGSPFFQSVRPVVHESFELRRLLAARR